MKNVLTVFALLLSALGVVGQPATAQEEPGTLYFQVDYMKVPEGGGDAYLAVERDVWKPLHEERVRQGAIAAWSVYGVRFGSPKSAYNYVTVTVFDDFAKLEAPYPEGVWEAAFPEGAPAGFDETTAVREMVHTEIWQLIDTAQPEGESGPSGRYIVLNYMHTPVGGESEYVAAEQEIWKPIHEARIAAGYMNGWGLYGLVLPGGAATHYNFGTVDYYDEIGDIVESGGQEVFNAAHPNATDDMAEEMMDRTNRARTLHKQELWELMDSTGGSEE
jgi:hypothetical protein